MIEGQGDPEPSQSEDYDPRYQAQDQTPVERLILALETDYAYLLERLTARLQSAELAAEVLHDAYLKLKSDPTISDVQNPRAYLYRMAINLASNERRKQNRLISAEEAGLTELPDPAPDPERTANATIELHKAVLALRSLSQRRRDIFLAKWRDEMSHAEIAARFHIHKRTVQKELASAEQYLRKAFRRSIKP